MSFSTFLRLIRIETNLTSALPALLGFLFSYWHFKQFNFLISVLFFLALMGVSAFVTAWNAVMDYHKAIDPEYRDKHNQLVLYGISLKTAHFICGLLMLFSLSLGIVLIFLTNALLLLLGGLCVLVTIFYTYSPFAFSRMPLGEILAGLVEGLGSFFLAVWVNNWQKHFLLLDWQLSTGKFALHGNLWIFLLIVFVGLATAVFNFNIMLADNLCDLEQDVKNERYTLPYYIGRKNGLKLLQYLYGLPFAFILIASLSGQIPWTCLIVFLSVPLIKKNTALFTQRQIKAQTFSLIIQNLPVFEGLWVIGMLLGILFL